MTCAAQRPCCTEDGCRQLSCGAYRVYRYTWPSTYIFRCQAISCGRLQWLQLLFAAFGRKEALLSSWFLSDSLLQLAQWRGVRELSLHLTGLLRSQAWWPFLYVFWLVHRPTLPESFAIFSGPGFESGAGVNQFGPHLTFATATAPRRFSH